MTNPLANKRILLGVTGSIAAYKAADLASRLTQAGALVDVVLTKARRNLSPRSRFNRSPAAKPIRMPICGAAKGTSRTLAWATRPTWC